MAKSNSTRRRSAAVTNIRKATHTEADVVSAASIRFPDGVDKILRDMAARAFEAVAALELCSELITGSGGPLDAAEGSRVGRAIDCALRTLKPITYLSDDVHLGKQIEALKLETANA